MAFILQQLFRNNLKNRSVPKRTEHNYGNPFYRHSTIKNIINRPTREENLLPEESPLNTSLISMLRNKQSLQNTDVEGDYSENTGQVGYTGPQYHTLYGDQNLGSSSYWQDMNYNNLFDEDEEFDFGLGEYK